MELSVWLPHKTVATIIETDGHFLMVEEQTDGQVVFNQPAGHLEPDESLIEAAIRETLEETRWAVSIQRFLGLYHHYSKANSISYIRSCFIGKAIEENPTLSLDQDIIAVHWLTIDEIKALGSRLRSPIVLKVLEDYLAGTSYPLSLLTTSIEKS
jgi:8-oxo-dGTP pyrophosphatase MutT (NUDIX family)